MPDGANDHPTIEEGGRAGRGHIGLIVLSSIAVGLVLGLVLDVLVFGGSRETMITGFALLSLAVGCAMLAELSARCTDQPQRWARIAALCFGVTGAAILILRPSGHVLGLLGWVWPILLVALVVWMFRESRRSLHSWSRRAVLYPAFVVLTLVALGGAIETVVEATKSNQPPSGGRTYLVAGHKLYLRCVGSGSPVVILFNGLGERTPSWAWVQSDIAGQTRVCVFDRAGEGWSRSGVGGQDAHQLSADVRGLLAAANVPGPYIVAGHSVGGVYALAYAMDYPADVAGVALIDSSTPYQFDLPGYSTFYSVAHRRVGTVAAVGARGHSAGIHRVVGQFAARACPKPSTDVRIVTTRTERRSRRVLRAANGPSPDQGSYESRWETALCPHGRCRRTVGMARCAEPIGQSVDEQRSSDHSRRDAPGAR